MEPGHTVLVVVGTGTAVVEPDVAVMSVGLEATADTPGAALGTVTQASDAVLAAARTHGITDTDIRTQAVSVNQKTNMQGQPISGYIAVHVLGLRESPISNAPAAIDAVAGTAGDTLRLGSFALSTPDLAGARIEAATDAVTDARTRATALAETAGVRLGPVLSIVEETASDHGGFRRAVDLGFSTAGAHMPIHAGTDDVTARLTITFRIEPDQPA